MVSSAQVYVGNESFDCLKFRFIPISLIKYTEFRSYQCWSAKKAKFDVFPMKVYILVLSKRLIGLFVSFCWKIF